MNAIAAIFREVLGLFVEDVGYAAAILGWVGVCAVVLPVLDAPLRGIILVTGLSAILVIGVYRATGQPR